MELACKNLYIFSCGNRCHARFIYFENYLIHQAGKVLTV
jgi:hypothetical protein